MTTPNPDRARIMREAAAAEMARQGADFAYRRIKGLDPIQIIKEATNEE